MFPRTKKILDELKAWCDEPGGHGRRAEVARQVGVLRQAVTHWFSGHQQPTAEQILIVQEWLKKQRRKPR